MTETSASRSLISGTTSARLRTFLPSPARSTRANTLTTRESRPGAGAPFLARVPHGGAGPGLRRYDAPTGETLAGEMLTGMAARRRCGAGSSTSTSSPAR